MEQSQQNQTNVISKGESFFDPCALRFLNRKERLTWKAINRREEMSEELKQINLLLPVEAIGPDEKPILRDGGEVPTVKWMALNALRQIHPDDGKLTHGEKMERHMLIKRIEPVDLIGLTPREKKLLCERVSQMFVQVSLLGAFVDIIEKN